jgi:hypothetical protein
LIRQDPVKISRKNLPDVYIYGTGKVVDMKDIETEAEKLFEQPAVEFIHVRSSTNNCYHFRIEQQLE